MTPIHPIKRNPMQMKGYMPRGSTFALQLCKAFSKEPIGGFWSELWISRTSDGISIWYWQNKDVLTKKVGQVGTYFIRI
jgi:hypothetical protein